LRDVKAAGADFSGTQLGNADLTRADLRGARFDGADLSATGILVTDDEFAQAERGFIVLRDGQELAKVPEKPVGKFGRPLFQSMTYHDTPSQPMPQMRYVDVSAKAARNADYALSRRDLVEWETRHGRLPDGCCVAMHSGWARYASDAAKYTGKDSAGIFHFPGIHPEAAEWLLNNFHIVAQRQTREAALAEPLAVALHARTAAQAYSGTADWAAIRLLKETVTDDVYVDVSDLNIRVTNRLKLNLGLRWQFTPYPSDKYNIMSSFDVKNMAIVMGQDFNTLYRVGATTPALVGALKAAGAKFETAQEAGLPYKLVKNNFHDFGPHAGFAYRAFDGPKSFVLRGGVSENYYWQPAYGWNDRWSKTLLDLNRFSADGNTFGSGNLYGVSQMGEIVGVFYNKDKVKTIPKTFGEFEQMLAKAKAQGETPISFGNLDKFGGIHEFQTVQNQFAGKDAVRNFVFARKHLLPQRTTTTRESSGSPRAIWMEPLRITPERLRSALVLPLRNRRERARGTTQTVLTLRLKQIESP
jgi:hypothetical protein